MITSATSHDYERVSALRRDAWELLEDYRKRPRDEQDPGIIVKLQDIANELGVVEEGLRKTSPPTETSPIEVGFPVSSDAAILLALAEGSVPLAASRVDEGERWLRVMREHGNVGRALQELGMTAGELATPSMGARRPGPPRPNPVSAVASEAVRLARERRAQSVTTVDVLFAVISKYGPAFDRALYAATRASRSALLATLADTAVAQPS
jgi:hypothetical protein